MSEAYREASSVLDLVLRRKASLKAAALAPSVRNKRRNKITLLMHHNNSNSNKEYQCNISNRTKGNLQELSCFIQKVSYLFVSSINDGIVSKKSLEPIFARSAHGTVTTWRA